MNRTSAQLRGLVSELDDKLASTRIAAPAVEHTELVASQRRFTRGLPPWVAYVAVTMLGIALGFVVVQPWEERCTYANEVCQIAELDIDALRITIPDSELIATLPNIDALDPNDELTAGDIFAMERFAHLNFEELLTEHDIDRLLARTE